MLAALRIESLAIIDSLEVRFDKGLNVLTGETGAGKSILIDALALLLGGRADPAAVRAGRDEAVVEGLFVGPGLAGRAAELGLPADGDELLVRRTISRSGRSRVHVNGALATVSLLATLTRGLVDVSGQHEQVSLLRRERHLDLLDDFGSLGGLRRSFDEEFGRLAAASREEERLRTEEAERERRRDYLAFQLRELDELAPEQGEDESLSLERRILAGAERIRVAAEEVEGLLVSGDGAVVDRLGVALRRLEDAARLDPRIAPVAGAVEAARTELAEAGRTLERLASAAGGDATERLAFVDERLEALRHLARKHGGTLGAALARGASMREELAAIEGSEARVSELAEEVRIRSRAAEALAGRLSASRASAAEALARAVKPELQRLGLENAVLEVRFSPPCGEGSLETRGLPPEAELAQEKSAPSGGDRREGANGLRLGMRLSRRGAEEAEFLFSANPGEEPRALGRAASGGELSRVLLALKRALARVDPVESYVFDEVDAGIGGATGVIVGQMLRDVAHERQVLCVTHLPQVAAFADVHLQVTKEVREGRTHSRVERLEARESRQRHLARMLSGSEGPASLAAAAELLGQALPAERPSPTGVEGIAGARRGRRKAA
ncbi:DNA repair protein RecN [Vulgatibacter incomptus]|uniref:DNA repair protein RecN n=1 Tax=Vulgatibacter incomptus TaxID=1391653 RepID=A0A0K1PA32_9BACT|nr:DNA repair protein RecN [Vulgatibacter incomptus]AKU90271.1 DNA repair protein RecN [Vulgatibacter incomptus]